MLIAVECKDVYLKDFVYDGVEAKLLKSVDVKELIKFYAAIGDGFLGVIDGGKVIGAGGIYPVIAGGGVGWLFANKEAKNHKKSVLRLLRNGWDEIIKKRNYVSIQAICLADSLEANVLIEHLGFKKQAKMISYIKEIL